MFGLFFLIIFLSGLGVLTGMILGIIGLATSNGKMRNIGLILFGLMLVTLIGSIFYTVNRAVNKVKEEFVDPFKDLADSLNNINYEEISADDVRSHLLSDTCTNPHIKFIIENSKSNSTTTITDNYYTYFGTTGFSRMPVIYPYAIYCWDSKDYGELVNEQNVLDVQYNPGGEEKMVLNVMNIAYDSRYILIQAASDQERNESTKMKYVLFDMKTHKSKEFKTRDELDVAATKAGFKGVRTLESLWDYDAKF